ncbi:MAG TPA: phage virion morphogenesis protein [Stenotrophomonas sp.]|nr:phage virion morphogenesis protein [Stenotrophomonas sp.]
MMAARVEITKDTAGPALRNAAKGLRNDALQPMLDDIGEYLLRSTRDRAARQVSPDGAPWAPLSPSYRRYKERKRPGVPMLRFDFHMLGDQLAHQVVGDTLLVGTNAPYGAIHQFGGAINRPARSTQVYFRQGRDGEVGTQFVKRRQSNFAQWVTLPAYTIGIPARPWLGLSTEDEQEVVLIASDHVAGLFSE